MSDIYDIYQQFGTMVVTNNDMQCLRFRYTPRMLPSVLLCSIPAEIVAIVRPPPRCLRRTAAVPTQPLVVYGDPFLSHIVGVQVYCFSNCATNTNEERMNAIDT